MPQLLDIEYYGNTYRATVTKANRKTFNVSFRTKGDRAQRPRPAPRLRKVSIFSIQLAQVDLDWLVTSRTCFESFAELVDAKGGYRPTIHPRDAYDMLLIGAYNRVQRARGDARRAFPDDGQTQLRLEQLPRAWRALS